MYDTLGRGLPKGHAQNWGAGFLPGVYPGDARSSRRATPIDNLDAPPSMTDAAAAGASSTCCAKLNQPHLEQHPAEAGAGGADRELRAGLPHADGRPRGARRRRASRSTIQKLYGLDNPKCTHFAKQCLIARRLVERGVRFVQIYSRRHGERAELGRPHRHRQATTRGFAAETDQPIAGAARPT